MNWPWTSRARLDDALILVSRHESKIADLERENRRLVNEICKRHGVQPVYIDPDAVVVAVPIKPPAPLVDVMQMEAPTVVNEVKRSGARSPREICMGIEKKLMERHQQQQQVARELEAVMSIPAAGNGTH